MSSVHWLTCRVTYIQINGDCLKDMLWQLKSNCNLILRIDNGDLEDMCT